MAFFLTPCNCKYLINVLGPVTQCMMRNVKQNILKNVITRQSVHHTAVTTTAAMTRTKQNTARRSNTAAGNPTPPAALSRGMSAP